MIREQKVYEIGTLVSQKVDELDVWLKEHEMPWQNGIIIDKVRMKGRYPVEHRYVIRWDSGEMFHVSPKVLKGLVKSGRFKILSEG
tara:strand:+ start:383 stop:640 length:258 start_codon:yes stop_codon:yes gene_type:complete